MPCSAEIPFKCAQYILSFHDPIGRLSFLTLRVHSLLVATVREGILRYVGQVHRGLSTQVQTELVQRLAHRRRPCPLASCPEPACWVEPELYCRVRFQDWTPRGRLRHAVFDGWLAGSK